MVKLGEEYVMDMFGSHIYYHINAQVTATEIANKEILVSFL